MMLVWGAQSLIILKISALFDLILEIREKARNVEEDDKASEAHS